MTPRVKDWVVFNDGDGSRTCQVVAVNQQRVQLELFPATGSKRAVRLWVDAKSWRIQPVAKAKVA